MSDQIGDSQEFVLWASCCDAYAEALGDADGDWRPAAAPDRYRGRRVCPDARHDAAVEYRRAKLAASQPGSASARDPSPGAPVTPLIDAGAWGESEFDYLEDGAWAALPIEEIMRVQDENERRDAMRANSRFDCRILDASLQVLSETIAAVDVHFDFRAEAGEGRDPDAYSWTLCEYHRLLWSKPLPNGSVFELFECSDRHLHHCSDELGDFLLTSDSVMQTFTRWEVTRPIIELLSAEEHTEFQRTAYGMGGMLVWPGDQRDGKPTMNQARGMMWRSIGDRIDLTLEAIRRHYADDGSTSPLADTIARYGDFFALFGSFDGYVRHFLLDDLVDELDGNVRFFLPFDGFDEPAYPLDVERFVEFRTASLDFVEARNRRIERWCAEATQ